MNKISLTVVAVGVVLPAWSLTVNNTPGSLSSLVNDTEATELVVTGGVNETDLAFVATRMQALETFDLSGAQLDAIPDAAFINAALHTVVLPEGVTSIGYGAFAGCSALSNVNFPSTLTSISSNAFRGTALTSVGLSSSCAHVGDGAFSLCRSLTSAEVHCAYLGAEAFKDDILLSTVVIGDEIGEIGAEAFVGTSLTTVDLSSATSLTSVGDYAFAVSSLNSVVLPAGLETQGEGLFMCDELLTAATLPTIDTIPAFTYAGTACLTADAVPEGVVVIGERAFYGVTTSLQELVLPSSLEKVGKEAFAGTTGIESYRVNALEVPATDERVWAGVNQPAVKLDAGENEIAALYREAEQWQDFHILWEYLLGDVNDDGRVNVTDFTITVRNILNLSTPVFIREAADYNNDGNINVTDLDRITGAILSGTDKYIRRTHRVTGDTVTGDMLAVNSVNIAGGTTADAALVLTSSSPYVAMQWLLTLPDGVSLVDCDVTEDAPTHSVAWEIDEAGVYHMMLGSLRNEAIAPGETTVVTLSLHADVTPSAADMIEVSDVLFALEDGTAYAGVGASTRIGAVTGVNDVVGDEYHVSAGVGVIEVNAPCADVACVVNVSGVCRDVAVVAGYTAVEVPAGVYIVLVGGNSYKVVVR